MSKKPQKSSRQSSRKSQPRQLSKSLPPKNLLEQPANKVVAFRDERGWKRYQNPKDIALGILIEAGELAEHFHYFQGRLSFPRFYAKC